MFVISVRYKRNKTLQGGSSSSMSSQNHTSVRVLSQEETIQSILKNNDNENVNQRLRVQDRGDYLRGGALT